MGQQLLFFGACSASNRALAGRWRVHFFIRFCDLCVHACVVCRVCSGCRKASHVCRYVNPPSSRYSMCTLGHSSSHSSNGVSRSSTRVAQSCFNKHLADRGFARVGGGAGEPGARGGAGAPGPWIVCTALVLVPHAPVLRSSLAADAASSAARVHAT